MNFLTTIGGHIWINMSDINLKESNVLTRMSVFNVMMSLQQVMMYPQRLSSSTLLGLLLLYDKLPIVICS